MRVPFQIGAEFFISRLVFFYDRPEFPRMIFLERVRQFVRHHVRNRLFRRINQAIRKIQPVFIRTRAPARSRPVDGYGNIFRAHDCRNPRSFRRKIFFRRFFQKSDQVFFGLVVAQIQRIARQKCRRRFSARMPRKQTNRRRFSEERKRYALRRTKRDRRFRSGDCRT